MSPTAQMAQMAGSTQECIQEVQRGTRMEDPVGSQQETGNDLELVG
jgi:hypothetical protein